MPQEEKLNEEDIAKIEKYTRHFSGKLFLLPDDETEQLALAERALYWVLTGVYPDSQTSIDEESHSEGFLGAVQAEVKKQMEILREDLGVKTWRASYDYWDYGDGPNFIKGGVSVYKRKGINGILLSVSTQANKTEFFGDNITGISPNSFEPLLNTSWKRDEYDHARSKASPEARKAALFDFDTIIDNLGFDKDKIYKEMKDYALYMFYDKVLGYTRIEEVLSKIHGEKFKPGELIDTLDKYVSLVFESLSPGEKEIVCNAEKKISTGAYFKLHSQLSETPVEISYGFNLSLVPCRIDQSGNFIWEPEKSSSYSADTTTKPVVNRETTPSNLAKAKLQAEKDFARSLDKVDRYNSVSRTWVNE